MNNVKYTQSQSSPIKEQLKEVYIDLLEWGLSCYDIINSSGFELSERSMTEQRKVITNARTTAIDGIELFTMNYDKNKKDASDDNEFRYFLMTHMDMIDWLVKNIEAMHQQCINILLPSTITSAINPENRRKTVKKPMFCHCCGYDLTGKAGTNLKGVDEYPRGFVEMHFSKDGYDDRKARYSHDSGYISIFFDNDMEFMIPVKNAKSARQVLYSGLIDFLNKHTVQDSAVDLYIHDIYLDNRLDGRGPVFPDDKRYWEVLKRKLSYRPHIMINMISSQLLTEKLKFLKARFAKGQKGKELPKKLSGQVRQKVESKERV